MEKRILILYRSLLLIFGIMILLQLGLGLLTILKQADVKGVESNVMRVVQKISVTNSNLYTHPGIPPFDINQYSPLYYLLSDGLVTTLGITTDEQLSLRYSLRGMSALFLLLALAGIYLYLKKRIGLSTLESILLPLFFGVVTYPWLQLARPDVLQFFMFVLLLHALPNQRKGKKWQQPFGFGILLAIALTVKMNALFFLPAFGCYFLWKKQYRTLLGIGVGFLTGLFASWGILWTLGYGSPHYTMNLLGGINNGLTLTAWVRSFSGLMLHHFIWCSVAGAIIFITGRKKQENNVHLYLQLSLTALVLFFLNGIGIAKVGAGEQYFTEALVTVLVLLALVVQPLAAYWRQLVWSFLILAGLLAGFMNLRTYGYDLYRKQTGGGATLSANYWKEVDSVKTYLQPRLQGCLFFSFNREINLSMPGHCTLFASDVHDLAFERKVYDYAQWQAMAVNGAIRYVVTHNSPGKVYGANLDSCFVLEKKLGRFLIFRSRRL